MFALQDRLQSNARTSTIPADVLRYSDAKGRLDLRAALCELMQRTVMPDMSLTPENLALSVGVGSVLDNLFFILADAGASALVPAPYYPMFDLDLGARDGVHVQPVHLLDCDDDIRELDNAFMRAQSARQPPRALLVTNPDNPTGIIYSEARVKAMLRWCVRKRVHCVMDECYCWSVFPSHAPFKSALAIAAELVEELGPKDEEQLWQLLHVIIGMSKDFCSSGAQTSPPAFRRQHRDWYGSLA